LAYLIDSSFAIGLERRRGSITELRDRFGDVGMVIATITLFDLLVGMHRANDHGRRARRQEHLDRLVALVTVLPFDDEVARRHARITAELTAVGERIDAHDLIIAATAIVHDLTLLKLDLRHFPRVPGLALLTDPGT